MANTYVTVDNMDWTDSDEYCYQSLDCVAGVAGLSYLEQLAALELDDWMDLADTLS